MATLQRIDDLIIKDYYYLDSDDECYFFHVYIANKVYSSNPFNQLIGNFKKSLDRKGKPDFLYKIKAISQIGSILREMICEDNSPVTLIPIPPSKCKEDELYDDRMVKALEIATKNLENVYVKDIIELTNNRPSSHSSTHSRLNPTELHEILKINKNSIIQTVDVILVDDVITTGSQFKACKELILQKYPNANVIGLFICRTQHASAADDFDD